MLRQATGSGLVGIANTDRTETVPEDFARTTNSVMALPESGRVCPCPANYRHDETNYEQPDGLTED